MEPGETMTAEIDKIKCCGSLSLWKPLDPAGAEELGICIWLEGGAEEKQASWFAGLQTCNDMQLHRND